MTRTKGRNLPFGLQIIQLGRAIEKKGINRDQVDLKHLLDRTLTYRENKRVLSNYIGTNIYEKEIKGRTTSYELFQKAQEINDKRKLRSQNMDYRKRAKHTYYPDNITQKEYLRWRKNPSRNDIEGVDTQGNYF